MVGVTADALSLPGGLMLETEAMGIKLGIGRGAAFFLLAGTLSDADADADAIDAIDAIEAIDAIDSDVAGGEGITL